MESRGRFSARKHLRVLGLALFEAHLPDESSRLVTKTLARRERLIRTGTLTHQLVMLLAQKCGQANVQDRRRGGDLPQRWELLPWSWISGEDRNESVNLE